jgi:hypothetical protein
MKRNVRASLAVAAAVVVAALSGCASLGDWNYAKDQVNLAEFGGAGGGDGGSGDGGSGSSS